MSLKVGEILVQQGIIKKEQLLKAIEEQKKTPNQRLTAVMISLGFVKEASVRQALEAFYKLPAIDVTSFDIDREVIQLVSKNLCEKRNLIPLQKAGSNLVVAFSDPSNMDDRENLRMLTKLKVQPVVGTPTAIATAIEKYYGGQQREEVLKQIQNVQEEEQGESFGIQGAELIDDSNAEDVPVVRFINAILTDAIRRKVSDIHFEPYEKRYRVRFRTDGMLVEAGSPPASMKDAIASRIKIMARLKIDERRIPQDGRIKIQVKGRGEMDFRVSVLPTIWGEKIVMRLLDKANLQVDMTKLGFEPEDLKIFIENIEMPQGMILITGPTGSGKTTTIYSALAYLNKPDVNISTAEDPVEFNFEGINQVQMNPDVKLTFASSLKAFLRQDPDVVMVGEIRDLDTAEIAFKAASTGHLVVSTLHTNDAPGTVSRLTEMGVAPYIITSTINLMVAQRLMGRVCENCKTPIKVQPRTLINLGVAPNEVDDYTLFKGRGCSNCNNTGIKGRTAIFELLTMTEKIRDAILRGASTSELRNLAREEGLRTLRRSALLKLKRGISTIEEVLNASMRDMEIEESNVTEGPSA